MFVQKHLVEQGVCSRKEAEAFLRDGLILVNGAIARPGVPIKESDVVTLAGKAQDQLNRKITVAIYKPRGVVCSIGHDYGPTVQKMFPHYSNLNIVGRLDKESEGLLLLSNDGLITKAVTGDTHQVEKEYEVVTQERVDEARLKPLTMQMKLKVGTTLPTTVSLINARTFRIVLHEGKNRQIRRMCGMINLTVKNLTRLRIGTIELSTMQPGDSRKLSPEEVAGLKTNK